MAADREIKLDLLATDKTGPATRKAADNLDHVADSADRASKSTDELGASADDAAKSSDGLGKSTEETSHQTDGLGKSSDSTAGHVAKLSKEIEAAQSELRKLHEEFAKTDDEAGRIDLSRSIRKSEGDIRRLSKSKGVLAALLPSPAEVAKEAEQVGAKVATGVADGISESASSASAKLSEFLVPVLGGVAVAAAPLIGATISAAIIGGAGVGGVIGGALLASKDPRVSAAGKQLGDNLLNGLEARANVFVDPMLKGVDQVEKGFAQSGDDISKIFDNSAKFVQPLTEGVTHALGSITHGIAELTDGAGPVIDALSQGVAGMGDAVEGVFHDLSDNGIDAAVALTQAFQSIDLAITTVGAAVNALTESYGFLAKAGVFGRDAQLQYITLEANAKIAAAGNDSLAGSLQGVQSAGTGVAGAIVGVVDGLKQAHNPAVAAAEAADAHAAALRGEVSALTELSTALRAQIDPAFALLTDTDKLATAQDKAAAAVKNHGRNSTEAKAATRELADAALQLEGDVGRLGGSFDGKLSPAMRATLRAAGLTESQIADVAKQLKAAKKRAEEYEGTYRAKVVTDFVSRYSSVITDSAQSAYEATKAQIAGKRAAGGPVSMGKAYIVGEKRAEVFVPKEDGTIVPSIDRLSGVGGGSAVGGGGRLEVLVRAAPNASRDLVGVIVEAMQYECRTRYGNDAQRMFGG